MFVVNLLIFVSILFLKFIKYFIFHYGVSALEYEIVSFLAMLCLLISAICLQDATIAWRLFDSPGAMIFQIFWAIVFI